MTIIQEIQKSKREKWSFRICKKIDVRDEIINYFEKGIFLYKDNTFKTKEEEKSEKESEEEL